MKFKEKGLEIGSLVQEKNQAYGDSFAKSEQVIKILYPNGIKPEQYRDLLGICRVLDKMFRIANQKMLLGKVLGKTSQVMEFSEMSMLTKIRNSQVLSF
ncbi:MAG: hypothetical protein HC875_15300 [Anaerolineales bacterium]|nr:hypothetical protein [Anaerolineales bacterium]